MSAPLRSASPGKVQNESEGTTHVNISRHVACEAKNSSEAFAARCDHCGSERIVAAGITLRKPFLVPNLGHDWEARGFAFRLATIFRKAKT